MSWWDYGHDIEYVAQRAPNANPFQDGVVMDNNTLGAAPFFTSTNETASYDMLNTLDSRYVVIDNQMATGKFPAIEKWVDDTAGWTTYGTEPFIYPISSLEMMQGSSQVPVIEDSAKWDSSIINRLYYDDCDGMSHYRLVYESSGAYYINSILVDQTDDMVAPNNPIAFDNYTTAEQMYQTLNGMAYSPDSSGSTYICDIRAPVKYVKVFEKVDGATITGSAPDGSNVTASLNLTTDWGRTFTYTQTATAVNGSYSMIVPYPTEKMQGPGYSYNITSDPQYNITYGNTTQTVFVPETAVMNGGTVQVT
jgi:dolichyl-diphosphooligosaccharide--protein glycosyltransferase